MINNDGGGFADYVDIDEGTTVNELFEKQVDSSNPENYLIRINRQPAPADQVLRDHYPTTLFSQSEAQPGRCMTLFVGGLGSTERGLTGKNRPAGY